MTNFEFTLRFKLPEAGCDAEQYVEVLAATGFDDALVGVGQNGRIVLNFTRAAKTAFDAISSALRDVRKAIPNAVLVEASPDFVGLTDVAEIAGFTRQNMRKLMTSNIATFPVAVHEGNPALWHLANVLAWLREQQQRNVDGVLMEVAETNMALNIAKEARSLAGAALPKKFEALFACVTASLHARPRRYRATQQRCGKSSRSGQIDVKIVDSCYLDGLSSIRMVFGAIQARGSLSGDLAVSQLSAGMACTVFEISLKDHERLPDSGAIHRCAHLTIRINDLTH